MGQEWTYAYLVTREYSSLFSCENRALKCV